MLFCGHFGENDFFATEKSLHSLQAVFAAAELFSGRKQIDKGFHVA
jgi:hypothetical protein